MTIHKGFHPTRGKIDGRYYPYKSSKTQKEAMVFFNYNHPSLTNKSLTIEMTLQKDLTKHNNIAKAIKALKLLKKFKFKVDELRLKLEFSPSTSNKNICQLIRYLQENISKLYLRKLALEGKILESLYNNLTAKRRFKKLIDKSQGQKLEHFNLNLSKLLITSNLFEMLENNFKTFKQLLKLDINLQRASMFDFMAARRLANIIKGLKSLTMLNLNLAEMKDTIVGRLPIHEAPLPLLFQEALKKTEGLGLNFIFNAIKELKKLTSLGLNLSSYSTLTQENIQQMLNMLKELKALTSLGLNLSSCSTITQKNIQQMLNMIKELKALTLLNLNLEDCVKFEGNHKNKENEYKQKLVQALTELPSKLKALKKMELQF
jgi:hypothetical protein